MTFSKRIEQKHAEESPYIYNRVRKHMSLGNMTPLEYYRRA